MKKYSEIEKNRKQSNFEWLNIHSEEGVFTWFLIQSIVNTSDMKKICSTFKVPKNKKTIKMVSEFLYSSYSEGSFTNDDFISYIGKNHKKINLDEITEELNGYSSFEWGGDYQGSLEKSLIKKYIKDNKSIDENSNLIYEETINYLRASKYNYLTSKLTESIFFNHNDVIPTINKIKDVDFFIKKNSFWDLKQTILPKGFLESLKKQKITDLSSIVSQIKENPTTLIKWLYENQGEMRFSSENRIFIIFVDKLEHSNSWKLKSNRSKLEKEINNFLTNNFNPSEIEFIYKGKDYKTKSALIMITNE